MKLMNNSKLAKPINKIENYFGRIPKEYICWLAVFVVAIFYILTLRIGHNWGGDFSQYIHHAKNIIEGKPYNDILYIVNGYSFVSPPTYPPVFPIFLAGVISFFGDSLPAMKLLIISFFALSLLVIVKLYRNSLNKYSLLLLILIIGFNPLIWSYKDKILSEFPYVFFSVTSLYLMQSNVVEASWKKTFMVGIFMYLAYGTREIGIILPLTLLSYDLWHYRKLRVNSLVSCSIFIMLAVVQWQLMLFEPLYPEINAQLNLLGEKAALTPSHLSFFNFDLESIYRQIMAYNYSAFSFWQIKEYELDHYFYYFITVFALIGFAKTIINKVNIVEIYFVGYLLVLILFGGVDTRYIVPIIPFYVFYVLFGLFQLHYIDIKLNIITHAVLVLFLIYLSVYAFVHAQYGAIEPGVEDDQAQALFLFIKTNTEDEDTIIFRKPRVLSLYTNRKSSAYPRVDNSINFMAYMKAINSQYLVTFPDNQEQITLLLKEHPNNFRLIFNNAPYDIYKYIP